jgi:hypothetical protein
VDARAFQEALSGDLAACPADQIEQAVSLYRSELLDGLSLGDSPEFELWLLGQRAHMRHLQERGLMAATQQRVATGQLDTALAHARRLCEHSPLLEEAHAQLIWLYAQTGQRDAALRQYEYCRALLHADLGVEPTEALQRLQWAVLGGRPPGLWQRQGRSAAPAAPAGAPDFVGRTADLGALQIAWQRAQAGQGGVIIIAAQAGGGKTRLIQEAARQLAATVYGGRCDESTQTVPYQPWLEILEAHLRQLGEAALAQVAPATQAYVSRLLPGMARQPLPAERPGAVDEPERLFTAIVDFLAFAPAGQPGPRLLVVDDLQWADEASLRLLAYVAKRIGRFPWLLVGAYRSEDMADAPGLAMLLGDLASRGVPQLALAPLSAAEIAVLIAHQWPQLAPGPCGQLAARLAQSTGGNPLFVTAVLRELREVAQIPAELPVPASVQALLQRRLGRVPSGRSPSSAEAAYPSKGCGFAAPMETGLETQRVYSRPEASPQRESIRDGSTKTTHRSAHTSAAHHSRAHGRAASRLVAQRRLGGPPGERGDERHFRR